MTATLDRLRHHIQYLSDPVRADQSAALARAFAAAAVPFGANGLIAPGLLAALEVELIYCAARHRAWLHAPLLGSVVSDYLARAFHLERAVTTSLSNSVLAAARQLKRQQDGERESEDDDFLSCVCIATATAPDADALELDLGFGTALLHRIKDALGILSETAAASKNSVRYIPELDALIAKAVAELAAALRQSPWALQQRRLHYLLLDLAEPWHSVLAMHGSNWVFDLLLVLAREQALHCRQLTHLVADLLPTETALHDEANIVLLSQSLAARGLMARERDRTWRALPLASELTAEAFAASLQTSAAELETLLPKMAGPFQAAALHVVDADAEFFARVILELRPLAPAGMQAAAGRLAELTSPGRARSVLTACLATETSFCLRRAAEEAVAKVVALSQSETAAVPL